MRRPLLRAAAGSCVLVALAARNLPPCSSSVVPSYALRNLQVDRLLAQRGIDPSRQVFQVGTNFYRIAAPTPFFYPAHLGDPPGSEFTLEQLKDILRRTGRDHLLTARLHARWWYPRLFGLLGPLESDPELEVVAFWPDFPRTVLYRFRPAPQPAPAIVR